MPTHPKILTMSKSTNWSLQMMVNGDNNDKTVVHFNCTRDVCSRVINNETKTPTDHGIFGSEKTGYFLLPNASMINKQPAIDHPSWWLYNFIHIYLPSGQTTTIFTGKNFPYCIWSFTSISHICQTILWCWMKSKIQYHQCYVYFKSNIILQGSRYEMQKLCPLPL